MQQSQTSTVAIATKILVMFAVLPVFAPPVAASPEICVLAPHLERSSTSPTATPRALVPLSRPTLFVREPLTEIRMETGPTLRWHQRPPADGVPWEGPLPWPLPPLQPGESVTVRLRPLGATEDNFATIAVQGAPLQRLREGDRLLRSLAAGRPAAWRPAIEALLAKGDQALATALLFATEGPNEPDLNALRRLVAQESCQ